MANSRNNFILEWNENREEDLKLAGEEVERAGEHDPEPEDMEE